MGLGYLPAKTKEDDKEFLKSNRDLNPVIELAEPLIYTERTR